MSESVAVDLAVLLRNVGLGPVIEGQFPAAPDEIITVRATGGIAPLETHDGAVYSRPRASVIVRAKNQRDAQTRALLAWKTLGKIRNSVINGTKYLSVKNIDSVADMGADEQNPPRRLATFNVQIMRAED